MDAGLAPDLLLAAAPDAPGARRLLADWSTAVSAPGDARLLLAGPGLAWAGTGDLLRLLGTADVAVCSRNAHDAGWQLETAPAGIRWSSVATWLAELSRDRALWVALP